jgi:hypothetical protein
MGMGGGRSTTGVIGGVAKAAPPPGAAVEAAGVVGRAAKVGGAAEAAAGGISTAGKVALGAGAAAGAGLGARAFFTHREQQLATQIAGLRDQGDAQLRASLEKEAAAGGAWRDSSWPYRLRGYLMRSDDARAQAGNPQFTRDAQADIAGWDQAYLRREWVRYFLGSAGESLYP